MSPRRADSGAGRSLFRRGFAGILGLLSAVALAGPGCADDSSALFGDSSGSGAAGGAGGAGGSEPEPITPAPGGARRIIARQYVESVRTLLGDAAAAAASAPADQQLLGLETIAASTLATPPAYIESYETSARDVALAAVADPATVAKLRPCSPVGADDPACMRKVVEAFAPLAWRRPLTEEETVRLTAAGSAGALAFGSFEAGMRNVLSAVLQSPYFLYIIELGEPDPDNPAVRRLTPSELVTRMSFFLVNSTPSQALLDAAALGALDDEAGIRAVAAQLVAQPEARTALDAFYDEVYQLRNLATVPKSAELFPEFTPTARAAMRLETLLLISDVVWQRDADAREILNANYTFVNDELAAIYGFPAVGTSGLVKVTPPADQQRAGFLTQGSFLARASHAESTSATRRGAFVQDSLLCSPIPPPPPGVNPDFVDDGVPKTAKQKLEQHQTDESCASCHTLMDPIGFALEPFDAVGRHRTTDLGMPIDATGDVVGLGAFNGPAELAALVHDDPRSGTCMMTKLYRHSIGHYEETGEMAAVDDLATKFAASGYSIKSLLVELCASPAFRLVSDPK
jgi:hypothetical protein